MKSCNICFQILFDQALPIGSISSHVSQFVKRFFGRMHEDVREIVCEISLHGSLIRQKFGRRALAYIHSSHLLPKFISLLLIFCMSLPSSLFVNANHFCT